MCGGLSMLASLSPRLSLRSYDDQISMLHACGVPNVHVLNLPKPHPTSQGVHGSEGSVVHQQTRSKNLNGIPRRYTAIVLVTS